MKWLTAWLMSSLGFLRAISSSTLSWDAFSFFRLPMLDSNFIFAFSTLTFFSSFRVPANLTCDAVEVFARVTALDTWSLLRFSVGGNRFLGTLALLLRAMLRRRWYSFLATRSFFFSFISPT
uniref:Putative secreted protein n=1 Tax=Ixodes ricinus TaxID=34613 RepID=A0A147BVB6_IXORI